MFSQPYFYADRCGNGFGVELGVEINGCEKERGRLRGKNDDGDGGAR